MFQTRVIPHWLAGIAAIVFYTLSTPSAKAEQAETLKAAFVLNFLKFAENPTMKPADTNTFLIIAVVGNDPLANALQTVLSGKIIQGRTVKIQLFPSAEEWKHSPPPCHALFLTPAAQSLKNEVLTALAGQPVLTIGEIPGFCAEGGMLNLYEQDNRIKFEANPGAAEKQGLKLRSELLKLATIVTTKGGQK